MTVREVIEILQKQPQDIQVAYGIFSEQCILEEGDIKVVECCLPRADGWIQDKRPDMESQPYLLLPGH